MLPDGNLLICDSDGQYIREVDRSGEPVWSYGDGTTGMLYWPRDADRLPGGNTLITDSKHRRILEVTPAGETVWEYAVDYFANFYDADRLPGGSTLISSQQHQEVLEVDRAGQVQWSFRNYTRPFPVNPKLLNTRFTELDESGAPREWVVARRLSEGGGELVWTVNAAGKRCPGLAFDRAGGLCLQQTRQVKAGANYRVSGLFCTEGLEGFACLQICFLDSKFGIFCDGAETPKSALFSGDTPWSRELFSAQAPAGAVAAEVRLFISGKGKVFVDELFCFG
jgi:hypothetical protein